MITNDTAKDIKKDFPILKTKSHGKSLTYLDSAASSQKPEIVIQTIKDYYEKTNANIHRGVYELSQEATLLYEEAHNKTAEFINSSPEEIIFTRNTTESINLLTRTLETDKKEIVLTELEHHSNLVPWQQFAKRNNMKLKFISINDDFTLDYKDAEEKITENTGIVAINHVSNAVGTINDVKKIVSLAKKHSALSVLDSAQAAPHTTLDVKDIGCDFLAFSSHKMLGPTGIGVLYGREELLSDMNPFLFGGDMIKTVSYEDASWNKLPEKFEAGTPNISGAVGFTLALRYLQKIGIKNIHKWERELLSFALEEVSKIDNVTLYTPGVKQSAGVLSFNLDGVHSHDVASILDSEGVCVRAGHHCCMPLMNKLDITGTTRASFYLYNTMEDVDTLISGIKKVKEVFT